MTTPEASIITLSTTVVASDRQVSAPIGEESAILHLDSEEYYALDPVGSRVWSLMAQPIAVSAIADAIVAEYDVDRARCEADLLALLAQLDAHGLVTVVAR